MVFNELLFFLGLMPITVLISFMDRSAEFKNLILILTTLIFVSWGRPFGVCIIFASVVLEYLFGLGISKGRGAGALLALDAVMNIGLLVLLGANYLFSEGSTFSIRSALLPVGVGYYTAKGFSYCFDVYTGRCKVEKNIFCLMTYMVCYHSLAAGPVNRYGDTEPYIRRRSVTGKSLSDGLTLFIIGLGKTVILAQAFSRLKAAGLSHRDTTLAGSWIGMISFFAECWFSFTGLCDMARALGIMNGFNYESNYRELSVGELVTGFVKSANTTLIKLFTDVSKTFTKGRLVPSAAAALIGCTLIALWYHISKPFLAVGLALGAVLLIEKLFLQKLLAQLPTIVKAIYVLLVSGILLGGIYFENFSDYMHWVSSLFGGGNAYTLSISLEKAIVGNIWLIVIAFFMTCAPAKKLITDNVDRFEKRSEQAMAISRITKTVLTAVILFICVVTLAAEAG